MKIVQFPRPGGGSDKSGGSDHNGGNPPGGDEMLARIESLEKSTLDMRERLVRVESKIDSIEKHGATKADVESVCTKIETMGRTLIQWSIGTAVVLAGIAFTAARFIPAG